MDMVSAHRGPKTRRWATLGHIEKSKLRGEAGGGRSTHQHIVPHPIATKPSIIPLYTIQQRVRKILKV